MAGGSFVLIQKQPSEPLAVLAAPGAEREMERRGNAVLKAARLNGWENPRVRDSVIVEPPLCAWTFCAFLVLHSGSNQGCVNRMCSH